MSHDLSFSKDKINYRRANKSVSQRKSYTGGNTTTGASTGTENRFGHLSYSTPTGTSVYPDNTMTDLPTQLAMELTSLLFFFDFVDYW